MDEQEARGRERLEELLEGSRRAVFFGGAGVSTESGIPDFRSADGIYQAKYPHPPEEIVSRDFFEEHTAEFFQFYRERILFLDAKPNPAHLALARLEELGKVSAVITQNIDGLHQLAGSRTVWELHGSVHRNRCRSCGKTYDARTILESTGIPHCSCGGVIKPDVVLYGENLDDGVVAGAVKAIREADLLLVGGTSLAVYPAAGLLRYYEGEELVLLNRTPTPADGSATLILREPIGRVLGGLKWMKGMRV